MFVPRFSFERMSLFFDIIVMRHKRQKKIGGVIWEFYFSDRLTTVDIDVLIDVVREMFDDRPNFTPLDHVLYPQMVECLLCIPSAISSFFIGGCLDFLMNAIRAQTTLSKVSSFLLMQRNQVSPDYIL